MPNRQTIALIAHDEKKDEMAAFAHRHRAILEQWKIVATGTTGGRIKSICPGLNIRMMKSGPLGGDQQIGAMVCEEQIAMIIFFVDPLSTMPHDVDVKALMRLAILYDTPLALNRATAELMLPSMARSSAEAAE